MEEVYVKTIHLMCGFTHSNSKVDSEPLEKKHYLAQTRFHQTSLSLSLLFMYRGRPAMPRHGLAGAEPGGLNG